MLYWDSHTKVVWHFFSCDYDFKSLTGERPVSVTDIKYRKFVFRFTNCYGKTKNKRMVLAQ